MSKPGKPRKIYEPETGQQWRSVAALAKEIGWSFPAIVRHIEDGALLGDRLFVFTDDIAPASAMSTAVLLSKLRAENFRLRRQLAGIREQRR